MAILSHVLTFPLLVSLEVIKYRKRRETRWKKTEIGIPCIISTSSDFNTVDKKIDVGTISAYLVSGNAIIGVESFRICRKNRTRRN